MIFSFGGLASPAGLLQPKASANKRTMAMVDMSLARMESPFLFS
jgi:hypothetical protein